MVFGQKLLMVHRSYNQLRINQAKNNITEKKNLMELVPILLFLSNKRHYHRLRLSLTISSRLLLIMPAGWCGVGLVEYLVANPSCHRIFYDGHMNNK